MTSDRAPAARADARQEREDLFGPRSGPACACRLAFVVGGYHGVVGFLILIGAAGSALAWHVGWLATRRADAAWFGWAAVTLPVTAIFQSITVYPDGVGGVLTLTGLWALLRAEEESKSGDSAASMAPSRRGARPAAMDALALCGSRRRPRRTGAAAPLVDEEPGRQSRRLSVHSGNQRRPVGRLLRGDLRPSRSQRPTPLAKSDHSALFPAGSPDCCSISGSDW